MKKIIYLIKDHFVEFIGFNVILVLIISITYLKLYKKTYVCESTKMVDNVKITEKYVLKQKNNKIKTIDYTYKAKLNKETKIDYMKYYNNAVKEVLNEFDEVKTSYKNNTVYVSYTLKGEDVKSNKSYKNARVFLKNVKASGFTCK